MAVTRLSDIIEPTKFTDYVVQNTMQRTALSESGVLVPNAVMTSQLQAGAHSFTVPLWLDLADDEADIINDDPADNSTPRKLGSTKQTVRKSFLHSSWSTMNLASEIAGADAMARIQERAVAYWNRQVQKRLISTLEGIEASNLANDSGDMIHDISAETGNAAKFSAAAVIETAGTLGDAMQGVTAIAMHSDIYRAALKADLIEFQRDSQGSLMMPTFRGLAVVVDDGMPVATGTYTTALFGPGAVGFGMAAPRIAESTEVENLPSAGNGGGQQILHNRFNVAVHPVGFSWSDTAVVGESPTISELSDATNWSRTVERKAVPLAFLKSQV
ncbi:major capsid protein [Marinobacter sp.]|uniref:major capsid protein n=1 Tax=Marinobacter sp. TaxID=50741 RepID=UPI003A8C8C61